MSALSHESALLALIAAFAVLWFVRARLAEHYREQNWLSAFVHGKERASWARSAHSIVTIAWCAAFTSAGLSLLLNVIRFAKG